MEGFQKVSKQRRKETDQKGIVHSTVEKKETEVVTYLQTTSVTRSECTPN